jgi:predicted porin
MKKSLLALAVLGAFAGVASAQSSVTLYGIIDMNLQRNDPKPAGLASTTGINSGHQSGSRWGIRGSEDLGGGLSAVFTLEGGFSGDTGLQGQGALFGRQVWAGLRSNTAGLIAAGRVATFSSGTGSLDMWGSVDPFLTGFGTASLGSTFSSSAALRVNNAIAYQSPKWGGFQLGLGYSFQIAGTENPGSGANNPGIITAASFGSGPFYGVVTYDRVSPTDAQKAGGLNNDQTHLQLGATFDLKVVKLHAAYAKEDNQFVASSVGTTNGADATAYMAGFTVPVGNLSLLGSYQKRDGKALGTYEADRTVWALGASYSLSRRTNLYFSYADSDGKKSLNNNAAYDKKETTVGMRHLF